MISRRQNVQLLISWVSIALGVVLTIYGIAGILKYGFYISARGSIGQIEGGLAPLFLLLGLLAIAYGVLEIILREKPAEKPGQTTNSDKEPGPD